MLPFSVHHNLVHRLINLLDVIHQFAREILKRNSLPTIRDGVLMNQSSKV